MDKRCSSNNVQSPDRDEVIVDIIVGQFPQPRGTKTIEHVANGSVASATHRARGCHEEQGVHNGSEGGPIQGLGTIDVQSYISHDADDYLPVLVDGGARG